MFTTSGGDTARLCSILRNGACFLSLVGPKHGARVGTVATVGSWALYHAAMSDFIRSHLIWLGRLLVVVGIVERLVPDELWELFQRVVPEAPSRPQGGGRRRHGDREVLAAIIFVSSSGCTWQQLPTASFGPSGATAHRRFTEWTKARVWAKLHRLVLDELGSRGELDWSRCAIDSVNMRALKRGA